MFTSTTVDTGVGSAGTTPSMPLVSRHVRQQITGAEYAARSCRINVGALPPQLQSPATTPEAPYDAPVRLSGNFRADSRVDAAVREAGAISRADLFRLAAALPEEPEDEQLRAFVVNVHAWSYGTIGFGYSQSKKVERARNLPYRGMLAARVLRSDGPTLAYASLYAGDITGSRGSLYVDGWGPALFTKYLYFADPQNQPGASRTRPTALILDRAVAAGLNAIVPAKPLGAFGINGWTAPQYAFATALLVRLAEEASVGGVEVTPGMAEAAVSEFYRG